MPPNPRQASKPRPRTGAAPVSARASKPVVAKTPRAPPLTGPLHDVAYVKSTYGPSNIPIIKRHWEEAPKNVLGNYLQIAGHPPPVFVSTEGLIGPKKYIRVTVVVEPNITGVGDATTKKEAERVAALSAVLQMATAGLLEKPAKAPAAPATPVEASKLSDGSEITHERARQFMDYYCRRFGFGRPDITFEHSPAKKGNNQEGWDAAMTVGGRRIGLGYGKTKKIAEAACYIDVTQYLESCDADLWKTFVQAAAAGKDGPGAPRVFFQMSDVVEDDIRELCDDIRKSTLYQRRPKIGSGLTGSDAPVEAKTSASAARSTQTWRHAPTDAYFQASSQRLQAAYTQYQSDAQHDEMRRTRASLPVSGQAEQLLKIIDQNDVTICMAATGSGKTTQVPQMIFDHWIKEGRGSHCNVVCTQPRRIAAISVATRVAKERGEQVGQTVGYQVRFEGKPPQEHGSITFCTIGIFLKWIQSAFDPNHRSRNLEHVTHVLVDEVHERDIDTDLLLVSLKRLMADRKARNKPLKVVLMSATIDPLLFQNYFRDDRGEPATVAEIPGRSFPVEKTYLDGVIQQIAETHKDRMRSLSWVFQDKAVVEYVTNEVDDRFLPSLGLVPLSTTRVRESRSGEDLELPAPLIALTIAHVMSRSESGHVLVFLPGWEDITATQKILLDPSRYLLGHSFSDSSKFSIHVLHSQIPIAEQQAVFEPAAPGVRRIILSTNIAETSVTIPDVVYVVDSGKVKENRFDPERRMSSLVSAWVGVSNLNQRAGRAGRHRPGEYYGMVSPARLAKLNPYQLVEMKRADLSGIVMHVKALNFPGMEVEDVLAATIEPPAKQRVQVAIQNMIMVGALDHQKNLTSLGRVLLLLPVDSQIGRMVLFGSFFRCLDKALTLAAILTNRDPFMSPPLLKKEANAAKTSWSPPEFRSDALATLRAFDAWWEFQSAGNYAAANRFCSENFLSKTTLILIQRIKLDLLKSLDRAGALEASGAGSASMRSAIRNKMIPPELNRNGDSVPLLAALIAIGSQPNFAIKVTDKTLRTAQDRTVFIHPSSINNRRRDLSEEESATREEKEIYAFAEKSQNTSTGQANPQTFLKGCTRLDPMTYVLFGAYNLVVSERGLECDDWLPIVGKGNSLGALDDVQRLKTLMESCMLRVFEGINNHNTRQPTGRANRDAEDEEDFDEDVRDAPLSEQEIKELEFLTRDVVKILDRYSEERLMSQSRYNSRPATPSFSPSFRASLPLPSISRSGHSTPYYPGSAFNSRPGTPSRLRGSAMY